MNLNDLTIGELKEIKSLMGVTCEQVAHPYKVGEKYLIRTVTHYYIGQLKQVFQNELHLSSASWIPDTGRYYDAIKTGSLNEVEPIIGDAIIGRGAIVECIIWNHDTPKEQK